MWKPLRWIVMVGLRDKSQKQSLAIVYCRHSRFAQRCNLTSNHHHNINKQTSATLLHCYNKD